MIAGIILCGLACVLLLAHPDNYYRKAPVPLPAPNGPQGSLVFALDELAKLPVKGRAATTGYSRSQFGEGWALTGGCDMRNFILQRDMTNVVMGADCKVQSGTLHDPYSGETIVFVRGPSTSDDIQIDHVVALSDTWQKGAQQLSLAERIALANDPLELLAVSGDLNQQKSGGDAASWLPPRKEFRCQYIARQIAVKAKYRLWVTPAEHDMMARVLALCPEQTIPIEIKK
jgi:hypothetical protein